MKHIEINGRRIGSGFKPYVIAEMSANHNGSLARALEIIRNAASAGADAVKIQTYTADTMTIDCDANDFLISGGLWDGYTLHQLYKEAHTPWQWHKEMYKCALENNITIFSSPFDETAVEFLETLNTPAYKIASFELIDLPLIECVASTKKPMIMSTGMASHEEIGEAIEIARNAGCKELAILHCVSGYPAPASDYNLRTLADIGKEFNVVVGLSDHTSCIAVPVASVALGCSIIEKHFTLKRSDGGHDAKFSIEKDELKQLCTDTETAYDALGRINYDQKGSEKNNIVFRRSLYVVQDVQNGEKFTKENVRVIRPGYGMKPKYIKNILGQKAVIDIKCGTPLSWSLVDGDDKP